MIGNNGSNRKETIVRAAEQKNREKGEVRLSWAKFFAALVAAGVFSGFLTEAFKVIVGWFRRRAKSRKTARDVVLQHLDPILKAADELVGKLHSLAREDFKTLHRTHIDDPADLHTTVDLGNIMYLFAHFWARLEILRLEGLYVNLNADEGGNRLMAFIRSLESRRRRVVDRAFQRGMGESLIVIDGGKRDCLTFYQFINDYVHSKERRDWFKPLASVLGETIVSSVRQRILVYGTLVHALLDTLDPDHLTTKTRDAYAHKLSKKSKGTLRYGVFPKHLPFVRSPNKYITAARKLAASQRQEKNARRPS